MAEDTSLISEYIDRSSIKADTDFMLQQLNAVLSGIRQVNSNKVSLDSANTFRTAAEGANALRQSTVQLVDAQGKLISTSNVIAGGLDKTTAGATKQRDALSALNAEYKVALRNSANMAIQFGEQSKEALDAADAAQKLKEKLDAATNIAKGKTTVNQTTNNTANTTATASSGDVSLTTNLDAIAQEQQRVAQATGAVVGELEKQQLDGILAANEWAVAQKGAGKAALDTVDGVTALAGVFENIQTPLQNYTGTLSANIQQSQSYKDRLKEIADQIKNLSADSPNYATKLSTLTQEQTQVKGAASDLNSVINQQVKYLQSAEGSTDQLNAKLFLMRDVFRGLSDTEKTSSFGQQLVKDIQTVFNAVKTDNESIKNFHDSIGAYATSLSPLFEKVSVELSKLKLEQQGLQDLSQKNPIGFTIGNQDRLNQVTASIEALNQIQTVGFKTTGSYSQQINTLDTALKSLSKGGTQSTEFLKEIEQELNQAKASVSVTGTTFANAFKVLENELVTVRQKLNDPGLSGAQLKQLEQEERLLTQLTGNLSQVFTTSRQELLAYREAAVQLGTSLGESDDTVVQFAQAVGQADKEVIQIRKSIELQSKNAPFLVGALNAVNGLVGAYSAASGAIELIAGKNEDLQKVMAKFQALLVIVNGLQAVSNSLQRESGVIQLALAAKMNLVNAARAIETKLFGDSAAAAESQAAALQAQVTATEEEVAAQSGLTGAQEGGIVAQEASAVAAEATTGALEAETVATEAAEVATISFRTVLISTGIGALIVGIIYGITKLVGVISDWVHADEKLLEAQDAVTKSVVELNDAVLQQGTIIDRNNQGNLKSLKAQLDAAEKLGLNSLRQLALRQQIAKEEKRIADQKIQQDGITDESQNKFFTQFEVNNKAYMEALRLQAQAKTDAAKSGDTYDNTFLDKQVEHAKTQRDAAKKIFDDRQKIIEDSQNAETEVENTGMEIQKLNLDERRKLILESTQIEADATKTKNDFILNSDRSNLAQRLAALKSNAEAERSVIRAQRADVFSDPSTENTAARPLALKKEAAELKKINKQLTEDQLNQIFTARVREVTAETDTAKQRVQIEIDTNKEIASNQIFTLNQRLQAQATYNADQKKLIDDNLKLQLTSAGFSDKEIQAFIETGKAEIAGKKITSAELLDIQTQYETSVLKLAIDNGEQVNNIIKSDLQKQNTLFQEHLSGIKEAFGSVDIDFSIGNSKEIIALNESLKKREISTKEYAKRRKDIEFNYQQEITQNLINSLEAQLNLYSDTDQKKLDAQIKVDNLRTQIARSTTDVEREELRKRLEIAEIELSFAKKDSEEYQKLVDNINKAKAALGTGATTKSTDDKDKRLNDLAKELGYVEKFGEKIASINDAIADRKIAAIQREQDALDAKHNRENDIINQTVLNQDQKNKLLAESDARYAASKNQLDQKAREAQRKKAVADKAAALFQIALNTAVAVVQALATPGVGIGEAIAIGALGAIELAAAAAAPLPQFKEGKNVQDAPKAKDRYEGHAVVGDGGKSELIIREDGRMEVTPAQSTITYLKSRDIVLPDAKKALAQMHDVTTNMDNRVSNISHNTTIRSYQTAQRYEATKSGDVHFERLSSDIKDLKNTLVSTIKNKKEVHLHDLQYGKQLIHSGKNIWEQLNR